MSKTHTVKSGDTLGKISIQYYGRFTKWNDIVKANPAGQKKDCAGWFAVDFCRGCFAYS